MAEGALRQMATPRWAEAPSRYKYKFDPQFDPTGMRGGANTAGMSFGKYISYDRNQQDMGLDQPLTDMQMFTQIDPYSGQLIGSSKLYDTFNKDPAAYFKAEREKLMRMPDTITIGSSGEDHGYEKSSGKAEKLALLDQAEKDYLAFQGQHGEWKKQFTNETLDKQLQQGLNLNAPNLESDVSARNRLMSNLMRYGITDMNQVGSETGPDGKPIYFNRQTGERLPDQIGHFKSDSHGTLRVGFQPGQGGGIRLGQRFEGPKMQFDDYMGQAVLASILGVGGAALGGALASAWGGTAAGAGGTAGATGAAATPTLGSVAGHAVGQAGTGALGAVARGTDVGQGALTGLIGGGMGGTMSYLNPGGQLFTNPTYANMANRALGGGFSSGINAARSGGDPMAAFGSGFLGSGISGGLTQAGRVMDLNPQVAGQLGGLGSQYIMGQINQRRRNG